MSKFIPTNGVKFQKGQSGNPLGAAAHNPVVKQIRKLTNQQLGEIATMILEGNMDDLKKIIDDPSSSVLKKNIAVALVKATAKGDITVLDKLMDRIAGKAKQHVELSGDADNPIAVESVQVIVTIPSNGREAPEE